jgi:hypothetical protein
MPKFQYTSDEERDYVDFGRVSNGTVVTASDSPDFRWASAGSNSSAPSVQSDQTVSAPPADTSATPA